MHTDEQPASPSIAGVMAEFLREEAQRLSPKTLSRYRQVLDLFQIYLDGYWPGESQAYDPVTKRGETFCTWFGPDRILGGYAEFLGYYMGHKVYNSLETKRAAGGVMKRFAEWLAGKGYTRRDPYAADCAQRATRALPAAERASRILDTWVARPRSGHATRRIEDHFTIVRVEAGRIWLLPMSYGKAAIGPFPVPPEATRLLKTHWTISGVAEKTARGWRLAELWNVTA
jgi:hypothetical protein